MRKRKRCSQPQSLFSSKLLGLRTSSVVNSSPSNLGRKVLTSELALDLAVSAVELKESDLDLEVSAVELKDSDLDRSVLPPIECDVGDGGTCRESEWSGE